MTLQEALELGKAKHPRGFRIDVEADDERRFQQLMMFDFSGDYEPTWIGVNLSDLPSDEWVVVSSEDDE